MTTTAPPADLAGSWWAEFARVDVELGFVDTWAPTGDEWDGGEFDVALWGESYLTPSEWVDVTADVMSIDVDTGRNGVDDPGDVGTASLVLFDPEGRYAIAGPERSGLGNLLRVRVEHVATSSSRSIFYGRVTEATGVGDLGAPSTTIKAIDLVGALLSTDDDVPLEAQNVTERIAEVLDRAGVPAELRALDDDTTELLAVEKPGNRLDAARGAAASSVGGTIWATGDGTITYRFGSFLYSPEWPPRFSIGTTAGAVCPSALDLSEKGTDVVNAYSWTSSDRDAPITSSALDDGSIRRFGRGASVRSDLLNSDQSQLDAIVAAELARTAWAPERVDSCSITVADDESAELVVTAIGDLIGFAYTGSAPWESRQLVGGYAHHIGPDEWTIDLRAYPAMVASLWDVSQWDVDTWTLGGVPMTEIRGYPMQVDLAVDVDIPFGSFVDVITATFTPASSIVRADFTCTGYGDSPSPRTTVEIDRGGAPVVLCGPPTTNPSDAIMLVGSTLFDNLTPGTPYTFRVRINSWAGAVHCRAQSQPGLEMMRLILSNA